jgi:hypothetical protein
MRGVKPEQEKFHPTKVLAAARAEMNKNGDLREAMIRGALPS